jgi:NAD(P)-dependent dehydrogenase (short-subunit alcohol dehydrogenase family)
MAVRHRGIIARVMTMGRFGGPKDLALLVAFLAGPKARYGSGAAVSVDGAMLRSA